MHIEGERYINLGIDKRVMDIFIEKENRKMKLKVKQIKADELLKKLKVNPSTVLVVKNGSLVTESAILKDSDKVRILNVVSGG